MKHAPSTLLLLCLAAAGAVAREPDPWTFTGNVRYSTEDLIEVAPAEFEQFRRTRGESHAEDAVFALGRFYLEEGYPLSRVEVRFVDEGAVFLVREGPRVLLGEVRIEGAGDPDTAETLAAFVSPPRSGLLGPRLYVEAVFESAGRNMNAWLRQRGHAAATVEPPAPLRFDPASAGVAEIELDATWRVVPGPLHVLTEIRVEGVGDLDFEAVDEALRGVLGKPWAPFTPFEIQGTTTEVLAKRGRPFARATTTERAVRRGERVEVAVEVTVEPGPPVAIGRITVAGNYRVESDAILREIVVMPFDDYSEKKLLDSQLQLFSTGLFSQVNASLAAKPGDPLPAPEADGRVPVDLEFRVEEVPFRRFEASIGFGSWELLRGSLAHEWLNLDGMGRSARVELSASLKGYRASGRLRDPWFLGGDHLVGTAEAAAETQERPTYAYDRLSFGASVSRRVAYKLNATLGWSLARTDVTDVTGDVPDDFLNQTNLSILSVNLTREARDSVWDATEGSLVAGTFEVSEPRIGSDLAFFRGRVRAIQLERLSESSRRFVLAGILEAGAIATYGDTDDVPVQERYFLGGGQSVRSFAEDDLGPRIMESLPDGTERETGTASGGEFFSRVSLELRVPVFGELETAVFADAGNVVRRLRDAGFSGYRLALGAGLRYLTPLGPVRLDLAVNPSPEGDEASWRLVFAIGYPF